MYISTGLLFEIRAGLVGNDGATHHGTFDLAYMGCVPDIVILAPSDEVELQNMVETLYTINDKPSMIRFPRGNGYGPELLKVYTIIVSELHIFADNIFFLHIFV